MNEDSKLNMQVTARCLLAALAVVMACAGSALALDVKASAATVNAYECGTVIWGEPGVKECRREGWIIQRRLLVSPDGVAWTTFGACRDEDTSTRSCYWNAKRRGNHAGHGFVVLPGRTVWVDYINGHRATTGPLSHQWYLTPVYTGQR